MQAMPISDDEDQGNQGNQGNQDKLIIASKFRKRQNTIQYGTCM